MIHESWTWRQDLLKYAKFLRSKLHQKRWTDASFVRTEQAVMIGLYAIRKLRESRKLTDAFAASGVKVDRLPLIPGQIVTSGNRHRVEELYDFDRETRMELCVMDLCNQVIHSYVLTWLFAETGLILGFLVASDRIRNSHAYVLALDDVARLFETAGKNKVRQIRAVFNDEVQDYDASLS